MFEHEKDQVAKVESYPGDISIRIDCYNPPEEMAVKDLETGEVKRDDDGIEITREVQMLVFVSGEILDQDGDVKRAINLKPTQTMADPEVVRLASELGTHIYGDLAKSRPDLNHEIGAAPKARSRRKMHHRVKDQHTKLAEKKARAAARLTAEAKEQRLLAEKGEKKTNTKK